MDIGRALFGMWLVAGMTLPGWSPNNSSPPASNPYFLLFG